MSPLSRNSLTPAYRTRFMFCLEKKVSSSFTLKSRLLYVITVLFPFPSAGTISQRVGSRRPSKVFRSEEHTSELQSPCNLVCRLLLEKKKKKLETQKQ